MKLASAALNKLPGKTLLLASANRSIWIGIQVEVQHNARILIIINFVEQAHCPAVQFTLKLNMRSGYFIIEKTIVEA